MNRKNILFKVIFIVILLIILGSIFTSYCYAGGITLPGNMDDIYNSSDNSISDIGGKVLWILQVIFYGAAVIILMYSGVKYMISAPDAKAEIKKKMIYLAVGAVMLFAAGGIVQIISNLALTNIK